MHNQLQISKKNETFPYVWVPNGLRGTLGATVSKIDSKTGRELARYRVCPPNIVADPSRTTVDLKGNCWISNRTCGTIVKIGLYEAGQAIDRNKNGFIDTSRDLNNNGVIEDSETLPWGKDECVLYEIVLIPEKEYTYIPGEPHDYADDYYHPGPRGIAVDADNNVWIGCYGSRKYYYVEGASGEIMKTVNVSPHTPYGATIDRNGILWSAGLNGMDLLRIDPTANPLKQSRIYLGHDVYGIALDYKSNLFVSGWTTRMLSKVNVSFKNGKKIWSRKKPELSGARGVTCMDNGDIWVSASHSGLVVRYSNEGTRTATLAFKNQPSGSAIDTDGKLWIFCREDSRIFRVDPKTNKIDLVKDIVGSGGHYTYSDMTGIISRTITTRVGDWVVTYDSDAADTIWKRVSWKSDEPEGTSIKASVRSSNDNKKWSRWEDVSNGGRLSSDQRGRYLQIWTTLQIKKGSKSPILYDLTITSSL
ncbi:MAG: hypothetical protein QME63_10735 [Actinomycetota bacterium]|nr:hypothetical protein [Actinomycetota bacterium]